MLVIGNVENDDYEISAKDDGLPNTYVIEVDGSTNIGEIQVKELLGYETE